jgi:hypothetical protein
MSRFNCEPDDELYADDTVDADEEYTREEADGYPGPFASEEELVTYYENKWGMSDVMSGFPEIGENDALGS